MDIRPTNKKQRGTTGIRKETTTTTKGEKEKSAAELEI
jgi:hypothetical protein